MLVMAGGIYWWQKSTQQQVKTKALLEGIKNDEIYLSISQIFRVDISLLKDKVLVKLNLIDDQLNQQISNDEAGKNFLGGIITGYMAIVVNDHIEEYDLIEVILFDKQGVQFQRNIFTKEAIDNLKKAQPRETFKSIFRP